MDIIANKKIENLPFDKTILCTITEIEDEDEGIYKVSFSGSQSKVTYFTAYAQEDTFYEIGDNVYVNVPQNDFSQQKTIISKYITKQTKPINYIAPLDKFIHIEDLNIKILENANEDRAVGLKANGETTEKNIFLKHETTGIVNQYDCLGVSADFKTLLGNYNPIDGEYGLKFTIIGLKNGWDIDITNNNSIDNLKKYFVFKTEIFSNKEMYGMTYDYFDYSTQQKLINLQDFPYTIYSIKIDFYQNGNFKDINGNPIPGEEQDLVNKIELNDQGQLIINSFSSENKYDLFVKNLSLSFGYLMNDVQDKELKLYTTSTLSYSEEKDDLNKKKLKLRWIEQDEDGIFKAIDALNDKDSSWWDNKSIYLYKYTYGINEIDEYAGPFWQRIASYEKYAKAQTVRPVELVEESFNTYKYKADSEDLQIFIGIRDNRGVIDVFNRGVSAFGNPFEVSVDIVNDDKNSTFARYKILIVEYDLTSMNAAEDPCTTNLNFDIESSEVTFQTPKDNDILILSGNYWINNKDNLKIYESNEITFENENEVAGKAAMALIDGLEIECVDGSNGIYRIYGEDNKIIAQTNSRSMKLRANFNAINILGLDEGEANITWYYPKINTMFISPVDKTEGYIYVYKPFSDFLDTSNLNQYYVKVNEQYYALKNISEEEESLIIGYERNGQSYQKADSQTVYIKESETVQKASWDENSDPNYYILTQTLDIENYGDSDSIIPSNNEIVYTIDSFYASTRTNNIIKCKIERYGREYWAEKEFFFGHQGNNGTNYAFDISLEREYTKTSNNKEQVVNEKIVPFLTTSNSHYIKVKATLIYGKEEITDLDNVIWKWETTSNHIEIYNNSFAKITSPNYATGPYIYLKTNLDNSQLSGYYAILKAEINRGIVAAVEGDIPSDTPENKQRNVTLSAYLPIGVSANNDIKTYIGGTSILYNDYGSDPVYYEGEHKLEGLNNTYWEFKNSDNSNSNAANKYYPTMYIQEGKNYIRPTTMYFNGLNNTGRIIVRQNSSNGSIIFVQPIFIAQNAWGNQTINQWDGALKIDKDNNYILSAMLGAGKKNDDNTFSGVLLGQVGKDYGAETGIYGYGEGVQTYGFREDGTAFIGASGAGRIEFDTKNDVGIIKGGRQSTTTNNIKTYTDEYTMEINLSQGKIVGRKHKNDSSEDTLEYIFDAQASDYPLKIGKLNNEKFKVQWDGTLHASNAILGSNTTLEGMALNTNNVALSAYISALKVLTENNKTQLSNTYSIYAETQNDVLIQNHAVGNTATFQTYYVNENTNTSPSTYTWYKKIKTSNAENPFGYILDSSDSAITFSSNVTYYIIKCSLKTKNITTYNDQGVGSTTSVTGIDEEQAGDFYHYSGTSATGYDSLYGKSHFKKLTDKELQSYNITLVSKNGLLRANNAIISGTIYANAGEIGGWTIRPKELSYAYSSIEDGVRIRNEQAFIYLGNQSTESNAHMGVNIQGFGSGTKYYSSGGLNTNTGSASDSPLPFPTNNDVTNGYLKNIIFSLGKNFAVDKDGNLFANNGNFNGTINAILGNIGGWTISSDKLYKNFDTSYSSNNWKDNIISFDRYSFILGSSASNQGFVLGYYPYIDDALNNVTGEEYIELLNEWANKVNNIFTNFDETTSMFNKNLITLKFGTLDSNKENPATAIALHLCPAGIYVKKLTNDKMVTFGKYGAIAQNTRGYKVIKYKTNGTTTIEAEIDSNGYIYTCHGLSGIKFDANEYQADQIVTLYNSIDGNESYLSASGYKVSDFLVKPDDNTSGFMKWTSSGITITEIPRFTESQAGYVYATNNTASLNTSLYSEIVPYNGKLYYYSNYVSKPSSYGFMKWTSSGLSIDANTYLTIPVEKEIGGQTYIPFATASTTKNSNNKYNIETIGWMQFPALPSNAANYYLQRNSNGTLLWTAFTGLTTSSPQVKSFSTSQDSHYWWGVTENTTPTLGTSLQGTLWFFHSYDPYNLTTVVKGSGTTETPRGINGKGNAILGDVACESLYINGQRVTDQSDIRLKQNLQKITNLDLYDNLIPYSFEWKENHKKAYGFIAQDIEKLSQKYENKSDNLYYTVKNIHPNYIKEDKEYSIDYKQFHALHVAKNHQQDARIQSLESEVANLRAELEQLKREKGGN